MTTVTRRLDDDTRALVEQHLPLVRKVLAGVAAHYPRHADREELQQAAALGLVEAAARYEPSRGVPFDRWAALRIRGAIVDAARALDFAPRALRAAARDVESARSELESELYRTPRLDEIAARLDVPTSELSRTLGRLHRSLVLSLDAPCADDEGDEVTLATNLVDTDGPEPCELLERRERSVYVRDAVACLPERLRDVVVGYFLDGESSTQLARRLGVTESRVSQLRSEGLALLRAGIGAQYGAAVHGSTLAARRQAAFADDLSVRSTYSGRLSYLPTHLPRPRTSPETSPLEQRAVG